MNLSTQCKTELWLFAYNAKNKSRQQDAMAQLTKNIGSAVISPQQNCSMINVQADPWHFNHISRKVLYTFNVKQNSHRRSEWKM